MKIHKETILLNFYSYNPIHRNDIIFLNYFADNEIIKYLDIVFCLFPSYIIARYHFSICHLLRISKYREREISLTRSPNDLAIIKDQYGEND